MMSLRIAWTFLWVGAVGAFAFGYWRVERQRTDAWREHFKRWGAWTSWRDKRIAEEFAT